MNMFITGVEVTGGGEKGKLTAELVSMPVVAFGCTQWLAQLGFDKPEESFVKINVGYATRIFPKPGDLEAHNKAMVANDAAGNAGPSIEDDR